jgi:hypothetical protein
MIQYQRTGTTLTAHQSMSSNAPPSVVSVYDDLPVPENIYVPSSPLSSPPPSPTIAGHPVVAFTREHEYAVNQTPQPKRKAPHGIDASVKDIPRKRIRVRGAKDMMSSKAEESEGQPAVVRKVHRNSQGERIANSSQRPQHASSQSDGEGLSNKNATRALSLIVDADADSRSSRSVTDTKARSRTKDSSKRRRARQSRAIREGTAPRKRPVHERSRPASTSHAKHASASTSHRDGTDYLPLPPTRSDGPEQLVPSQSLAAAPASYVPTQPATDGLPAPDQEHDPDPALLGVLVEALALSRASSLPAHTLSYDARGVVTVSNGDAVVAQTLEWGVRLGVFGRIESSGEVCGR